MSQIRRDDNMSRTWNTRIEQNIHLPLKSYSPWSLVSSTFGLSHEMKCERVSITMAKKNSHIRYYIMLWLSIGLAEIRTRRILREKAECKQSRKSMNKNGLHWKYFKGTVRTFGILLSQERHRVVRMVTRMQWWLMITFCSCWDSKWNFPDIFQISHHM